MSVSLRVQTRLPLRFLEAWLCEHGYADVAVTFEGFGEPLPVKTLRLDFPTAADRTAFCQDVAFARAGSLAE